MPQVNSRQNGWASFHGHIFGEGMDREEKYMGMPLARETRTLPTKTLKKMPCCDSEPCPCVDHFWGYIYLKVGDGPKLLLVWGESFKATPCSFAFVSLGSS